MMYDIVNIPIAQMFDDMTKYREYLMHLEYVRDNLINEMESCRKHEGDCLEPAKCVELDKKLTALTDMECAIYGRLDEWSDVLANLLVDEQERKNASKNDSRDDSEETE